MNRRLRKQNVVQQVLGSGKGALCGLSRHWYMAILGMVIVLAGVACQPAGAQTSEWVWMGGSKTAGAAGVYGTLGVSAAGNIPGARQDAFTWTDASGNLWLFGGTGKDSAGTQGELNDFWEFNPPTNQWTWISGNNIANATAEYGTQGVSSTSNIPGPRDSGVAWTDKSGNLWLFGGRGYDSTGKQGFLNDLWEYSPSTQSWTWVSGSKTANSTGTFGTQGVASATNVPSAREGEDSGGVLPGWTDNDGNLWLFGGDGYNSASSYDFLNDLWEYSPASGMWTWVNGSKTANGSGVYGTQGVAGAGNTPSGRQSAQAWKDKNGNFWLHGGWANDVKCPGNIWACDDSPEMWEFNPVTKEWTWISGQDSANTPLVYGTQGVASDTSNPGGREMAATWVDEQGDLWLFSGYAIDGQNDSGSDDLWMYNTTANQWTWVGGGSNGDTSSVYGSLGVPSATNWPDSRGIEGAAVTWVDAQGNFWLFGGQSGNNSNGGYIQNDLWVYHASPAATPTFSVSGGTYTTTQIVTISDATPGAAIYYTTNGTTPSASSSVYSKPLTVSSNQEIESVAIASGYPTSATAIETYTILKTPTVTLTLASSSVTTTQSFTVTVTVSGGTGNPTPTGTVTLTSGNYTFAAATLSGGSATMTLLAGSLAVGSDTLAANYTPDSNSTSTYNSATGNSAIVTVSKATPTVVVTPGASSLLTTQSLTVTVVVSGGTGNPSPTGSVTLTGGSYASVATAVSGGTAIITIPANTLSANSYTFKASYTPDASSTSTYNDATGTSGAVTVSKAAPILTVTPASSSITTTQSLSVTVAVSGGTGSPTTTGSATLTSGTYTSAATALSGGSATMTIPAGSLAVGSDTLTASYIPDSSSSSEYSSASGTASSPVMVTAPLPTISISSSGTITVNQGATSGNTSTITTTPSNGFTGTVALSCSVATAPANATSPVTCSIPPSVGITGPGVQTVTLTANSTSTTTIGTYAIAVTAQSGSITQTIVVNVTVNTAPSFTSGSGGTTSMTVTPGSTAGNTGTINVAGTNGFSGTVNLTCNVTTAMSSVHDMPTCSMNPTSVTINSATAQSSTLTVSTTAATSAENHMQQLLWPSAEGTAMALVAFFVSPRRRRNWLALFGAFVFLAIIGATGCGGGSSAGSGGGGTSIPGTTAGTYTVTVTGTSSGSSGSVAATVGTVTLTVN